MEQGFVCDGSESLVDELEIDHRMKGLRNVRKTLRSPTRHGESLKTQTG